MKRAMLLCLLLLSACGPEDDQVDDAGVKTCPTPDGGKVDPASHLECAQQAPEVVR